MNVPEIMQQLEAWGSQTVRDIYARQGAGPHLFGVQMGKLRDLAKQIGIQHELALELWNTGNEDAMMLATMLMNPKQLDPESTAQQLLSLSSVRLSDELLYKVIAKSPVAEAVREQLLKRDQNKEILSGRYAWQLLTARVMAKKTQGLDLNTILDQIDADLGSAPKPKQEAMNRCMVEIAVRHPEHRERVITIAEKYGPLDDRPIPKGCTSSYAPEWIAAVLRRKGA